MRHSSDPALALHGPTPVESDNQTFAHYHAERNHQGLANRFIEPADHDSIATGRVARRKRLGGILSYYHREAA
jgi:hypothetical protein